MKSFDPDGKFRNTQGESWYKTMDDLATAVAESSTRNEEQTTEEEWNVRTAFKLLLVWLAWIESSY